MATIMKKTTYSLLLPFLMTNLTTNSMDLPVHSARNDEKIIITGKLYIALQKNPMLPLISYADKNFHTNVLSTTSFKSSSLIEPCITVLVVEDVDNNQDHCFVIPAKYLFNLNDGSAINFTYQNYRVNATCTKNPPFPGKNFAQEYTYCMKFFYIAPIFIIGSPQDLIDKSILTFNTRYELVRSFNLVNAEGIRIPGELKVNYDTCEHGPNGCANKKRFIELMAAKQTKTYGNSMHQLVMQRQYGKQLQQQPKKTSAQDIKKEFDKALVPSYQTEYGKHGNECILL